MLITSRANAQIKQVRKLLRSRRERERTGLFFAEGAQLVAEALRTKADVETLILAPDLMDGDAAAEIASLRQGRETPTLEVTPEVFGSLSPKDGRQGVAALVRQRWDRLDDIGPADESCWVAVSQIQHPGSLGTILRVSDSVGGQGVILIGESTDPYDPTAVRASLGAIFSQRVVQTSFEQFAAWRGRCPCSVVGTSPAAETDYRDVSYELPLVLFLGSERIGLSAEQEAICDVTVRIPMAGRCDSHHVAVAAAIVLYEILGQRESGKPGAVRRGERAALTPARPERTIELEEERGA